MDLAVGAGRLGVLEGTGLQAPPGIGSEGAALRAQGGGRVP